jgi:hypothetical protein
LTKEEYRDMIDVIVLKMTLLNIIYHNNINPFRIQLMPSAASVFLFFLTDAAAI